MLEIRNEKTAFENQMLKLFQSLIVYVIKYTREKQMKVSLNFADLNLTNLKSFRRFGTFQHPCVLIDTQDVPQLQPSPPSPLNFLERI